MHFFIFSLKRDRGFSVFQVETAKSPGQFVLTVYVGDLREESGNFGRWSNGASCSCFWLIYTRTLQQVLSLVVC